MIIVHHLENSRSQRILWLLEELELEYDIKLYKRDPVTSLAPQSLIDVHPLGKSPVITDGDITVAESGAIIEYLVAKHGGGKLQASGEQAQRDYTYYMHYAEGTMMPYLIVSLLLSRIDAAKVPFFVKPIAKGITGKVRESYLLPNLKRNLDFLEAALDGREWFTGNDLTGADVQMGFVLEGLGATGRLDNHPRLKALLQRCHDRPAYQRALERGGPFKLGLANKD
ncbi:MAG: glutathione S-transferase [Pseudomonadota bacterium]